MKTIYDIINGVKGCQMGALSYVSECKLPKYLGLGKVTKVVEMQCQFNYTYENAVNNRIEKMGGEGTFKAEELPWGKWEIINKVISHKGEFYLRFYSYEGAKVSATYYENGLPISAEHLAVVKEYQQKSYSTKQAEYGLTEHQVMPKNVKFANITYLCVGGETYEGTTETKVA